MPTLLAKNDAREAPTYEEARPTIIETSRGNVEAITWGEGPAVLALHGAMGGYDQGMLLARTVVSPRYRFISVSRPGYLGTSLSAGRSPQEQADLCAEVLAHFGIADATSDGYFGRRPNCASVCSATPRKVHRACDDIGVQRPTQRTDSISVAGDEIDGPFSGTHIRDAETACQRSREGGAPIDS